MDRFLRRSNCILLAVVLLIGTVALVGTWQSPDSTLGFITTLGLGLGITLQLSDGTKELQGIKEMRELAGAIYQRVQALAKSFNERKEKRAKGESLDLWPADERANWEAANKDYDLVRAAIDEEERSADVAGRLAEMQQFTERSNRDADRRPGLDDRGEADGRTYRDMGFQDRDEARAHAQQRRDAQLAFRAWAYRGIPNAPIGDDHIAACQRMHFDPQTNEIELRLTPTHIYQQIQRRIRATRPENRQELFADLVENRALSKWIGEDGGYVTSPGTLVASIELAMIEYGAMLQVADTITTATGEPMGWPVGDDTANEGQYTDENVQETTNADPTFESVRWGAYDLNSKFVKIPFQLMRDSVVNIEAIIGQMLGERIGRILSSECTTGAHKIRGIVTRAAVGETSAGATAITRGDILGLQHSIDPAIRTGCRFMFHDNVLEAIRLILDTNLMPIYQENTRTGGVDTIEGWPFVINQKMASSIAASAKTMVAGRLENYKIRRVGSMRLKRLVERFAEYDQTAFIMHASADGNLLRPVQDTACPVKVLQQHA